MRTILGLPGAIWSHLVLWGYQVLSGTILGYLMLAGAIKALCQNRGALGLKEDSGCFICRIVVSKWLARSTQRPGGKVRVE